MTTSSLSSTTTKWQLPKTTAASNDNLRELRETNGQSEHNYFKSLGYDYIYVAEGNDLESVINALKKAKDTKNPIVVHLNTQKGEGVRPC